MESLIIDATHEFKDKVRTVLAQELKTFATKTGVYIRDVHLRMIDTRTQNDPFTHYTLGDIEIEIRL
jgi:hypothetical protein